MTFTLLLFNSRVCLHLKKKSKVELRIIKFEREQFSRLSLKNQNKKIITTNLRVLSTFIDILKSVSKNFNELRKKISTRIKPLWPRESKSTTVHATVLLTLKEPTETAETPLIELAILRSKNATKNKHYNMRVGLENKSTRYIK